MQTFQSLEALSHLDYSQMRALDNHRATNLALLAFHRHIVDFFSQFQENEPPNLQTLTLYVAHMHQIVAAIIRREYQFFLNKYQNEYADMGEETIQDMALAASHIHSIHKIPDRMQYWAAGVSFGDTIRFAEQHRNSVKLLTRWNNLAEEQGLDLNTPQP